MKKSAIALAVLGALAGAASAQSVTLYGVVDGSINYQTPGDNVNGGESVWRLSGDGSHQTTGGSRWGMRIAEDLGGGLTAIAVLESGFNSDTGTSGQSGRLFGRQSYVGIKSKVLGEIRMGRQQTMSYEMMSIIDPGSNASATTIREAVSIQRAGFGVAGAPGTTTDTYQMFGTYGDRRDNAIHYYTPSFGGFEAALYVAAGEGSIPRTNGGKLTFKAGQLLAGVSYEQAEKVDGSSAGGKSLTAGVSYGFGVAKLHAGYNQVRDLGFVNGSTNGFALSPLVVDSDAYTIGATVPLGNVTVLANYTAATFDLAAGGDRDLSKVAIAAQYNLSKRTRAYASYERKSGDLADFATDKSNVTVFGVWHAF